MMGVFLTQADLQQFDGLRLHTLGRIDHHDCCIGGGKHTVAVLREVLVAQVSRRLMTWPAYSRCITELTEMPRCFSTSIQSEVA